MVTVAEVSTTERTCPICAGHGAVHGRAFGRLVEGRHVCGLCAGRGSVKTARLAALPQLRAQMQRVADLMQAGDAEQAAAASRVAFRFAVLMALPER